MTEFQRFSHLKPLLQQIHEGINTKFLSKTIYNVKILEKKFQFYIRIIHYFIGLHFI